MKISIKSQTVLKRGKKKAKLNAYRPEKTNCICGIVIPLSQKTSKLQEYQKFLSSKL